MPTSFNPLRSSRNEDLISLNLSPLVLLPSSPPFIASSSPSPRSCSSLNLSMNSCGDIGLRFLNSCRLSWFSFEGPALAWLMGLLPFPFARLRWSISLSVFIRASILRSFSSFAAGFRTGGKPAENMNLIITQTI